MFPSGFELVNFYNFTANQSNSGRRRGPTVARSVVLEAVNVDPGSGELPAFLGQVIFNSYVHGDILSYPYLAEEAISLTCGLIMFKFVVF